MATRTKAVVTRAWSVGLYRNSLVILMTTAVTSALGFVFWALAARGSGPAVTGVVGSLVSAVHAAGLVTSIGLIIGSIPLLAQTQDGHARRNDAVAAAVAVGLLSLMGGLVLVTVVPSLVPTMAAAAEPGLAIPLVVLTVVMTVGQFIDNVALTMGRSPVMLVRGTVASLVRMLVFLLPTALSVADLIWAFVLSTVFADLVAVVLLRPSGALQHVRGALSTVWGKRRFYTGHHMTSLGSALAVYVLPVIVLGVLGPVAAGYFYPTWLLGGLFFAISPAVANAYMVRHRPPGQSLRRPIRQAAVLTSVLLAGPLLLVAVAPGPLLSLFGAGYAEEGRVLLLVLALGSIPDAVTNIAVATLRVLGRLGTAATLTTGMSVVTLATAAPLLAVFGITGGGLAWTLAQTAGALTVPFLFRSRARTAG